MKTRITIWAIGALLLSATVFAQDKTKVTANSSDISDNLDLRAVATVFGDVKDLEDFEQRLNDPKTQISNLDLNNDNYVDYLRVIESIEENTHIVVVQAVLGKDLYQDVATIEVERDRDNRVQVQVVGDVYMYGSNYIYEPVYVHVPVIYNTFWVSHYRPYCSSWYWGYYPSYYYYWNPFPIFRYRNHIHVHINYGHSYHYVTHRRCQTAYYAYYGRRGNYCERTYPNRSFNHRNSGYSNRYEMDNHRTVKTRIPGSNELTTNEPRNNAPRGNTIGAPRTESQPRNQNGNTPRPRTETPRENSIGTPRNENTIPRPRTEHPKEQGTLTTPRPRVETTNGNSEPRVNNQPRYDAPRNQSEPRGTNQPRYDTPRNQSEPRGMNQTRYDAPRGNTPPRMETPRSQGPRFESQPKSSNQGMSGAPRGGGRENNRRG